MKIEKVNKHAADPVKVVNDEGEVFYDLYPCFSQEYIIIYAGESVFISAGVKFVLGEDAELTALLVNKSFYAAEEALFDTDVETKIKITNSYEDKNPIIISKNLKNPTAENMHVFDYYNDPIVRLEVIEMPKIELEKESS